MRTLSIERRASGVAQVTMSRPEVFNAFDEAMIADLDFAFATLAVVQQVVPADALDAAVDEVVRQLLAGGPGAQREIKQLFVQLEVGPITPEVRELTAATIARVRGTPEAKEGFAAFLAKRPPAWSPSA